MKKLILPIAFVLLGTSAHTQVTSNQSSPAGVDDIKPAQPYETFEKFETLLNLIGSYYVDDVNQRHLVEEAIVAMLEKLDPHSIYIPKEELEDMNAPLKGNFEGIGVRFQILKDTIMVVNPIPGGPSEKLGIRAGDKIVTISGENVAGTGIKNSDVRDKLLGDKGTQVKVGILRKGTKEAQEYTITRDKIPIYSVDCSYMVQPGIGYIKINNFAQTTLREFTQALGKLKEQGMTKLVVDLQGNGGGYLNTAIDLADQFLEDGRLIVYTKGRSFPKAESFATSVGSFEKGDLVFLIDESSASASEILSGAIQDWDRGLIIGRRSFGKGLVQRQINLPDSSAVRLTISRYYTPTGRSIQKPYEDGIEAYHMEKYDRFLNGELTNRDSIKLHDSLKYETRITKRMVYGGGGILPDIFVGLDTSYNSEYLSAIIRNGLMNEFALEYVDKNRKTLAANYPDFDAYNKNFDIKSAVKELIAKATKEEIPFNEEQFKISEKALEIRLKASIAANLWDYERFYQVINELNQPLQRAVEILQSGEIAKMKLAYTR
jgi:carboxyl-terminal processing protease